MNLSLHLAAIWHWTHSHVHDWHCTTHWHIEHLWTTLRTTHHLWWATLESSTSIFGSVLLTTSSSVLEELRLSSGHLLLHEHLVRCAHCLWSSSHHLLLWEFLTLSAHHWLTARCHRWSLSGYWWLVRLLWLLLI